MSKRYKVTYERDEDGVWVAVIDHSQGASVIADGRSIGEARKRIRGALAVFLGDKKAAEQAELVDDVKLPARVKSALVKAVRVREQAQKAQVEALAASAAVAQNLTAFGVSTRDAAELLGVSHQLVHKYAAKVGGAPRAAAKRAHAKPPRSVR